MMTPTDTIVDNPMSFPATAAQETSSGVTAIQQLINGGGIAWGPCTPTSLETFPSSDLRQSHPLAPYGRVSAQI